MRKLAGALLVLPLFLLWTAVAYPCTDDAECDNGDTCSEPDRCVSGSCVLGGGGDANGDLVCDDELDSALDLRLTKLIVRLRALNVGAVKGGADVDWSGSPLGALLDDTGLSLRVKDALSNVDPPGDGIDTTIAWGGTDCASSASTGVIKCESADHKASARLKPTPLSPNQYRLRFKIAVIPGLTGPFFGPLHVVVSHGDRHRSDEITDCKFGKAGIKCREF